MSEISIALGQIQRPRTLIRAARFAAASQARYRAGNRRPVQSLLDEEATLNAARLSGTAGYSPTRHVQVMSDLLHAAMTAG
jgi:hypothetical protein